MSHLPVIACIFLVLPSPGVEAPYPQRLLKAVTEDPETARRVVEERPHEALAMFHFYMSSSIRWELEGDLERARYFRTFARRLAPVYDAVEGGEFLTTAVTMYDDIACHHARRKVSADGLFREAEQAYAEGRLHVASDKAAEALEVYEAIGDLRGQALAHHLLSTLPAGLRGGNTMEDAIDAACQLFRAGGDAWREAEVREQRATLLHRRGYLRLALTDVQRVRSLYLRTGREERAWKPRLQGAVLLLQIGQLQKGLEEATACEAHYKSSGSPGELAFARSQVAAGLISGGRYAEGIQRFQMARESLERAGSPAEDSARLHLQFGGALDEVGLYDRAERHLRRALELARAAHEVEVLGAALNARSRLELDRGEPGTAAEFAAQARELPLESLVERARSEHLLGLSLLTRGESSGLEHLVAGAGLFEATGDMLGRLSCELDTASALLGSGRIDEAEERFERVLEGSAAFQEVAWRAHAGLGAVREQGGDAPGAIAAYREAVASLRGLLLRTVAPSLRAIYRESRLSPMRRLVTLLARRGDVEEALREAQYSKAIGAATRFEPVRPRLLEGVSPALTRERQSLLEELESVNRSLDRLPRDADPAVLELKARDLRRSYEELLLRIDLERSGFGEAFGVLRPLDIAAVERTLAADGGQAALCYLVTEEVVHLWTIRPGKLTHREIPIGIDALRHLLDRLRVPFTRFRGGHVDLTHLSFDTRAASRLQELLVAPALEELEGISRVFVVPDGPLHHLPFEALVTRGHRGRIRQPLFSEYRDCEYLVERWAISYLPSLRLLEQSAGWTFREGADVLILADPEGRRTDDLQGLRAGRGGALPSAREEARAITRALVQGRVTVLLGRQATEGAFRKQLRGSKLVHLATHAWVRDGSPLFSGIQLAADPDNDGLLEAHELLDFELGGALIVLSGCETANGPLRNGEGLESLARAWLLTGATGVVGSLWRVDDASALLMQRFYQELARGASPPRALQRAKVALIRGEEGAGYVYALPYFWAPFVLTGALH